MRSTCILSIAFTVVYGLSACHDHPTDPCAVDSAILDAPAVIDAWAGAPHGQRCEPVIDQCAEGLTCRVLGDADGVCLPAGSLAEGDICTTTSDCGEAMACHPAELGRWRCVVVCHVPGLVGPQRCAETQICQRYWSDNLGFCQ